MWTIKRALDWCQGYLARHGDANPRLSAQHLLAHVTSLSRIELYTNFDQPLTSSELETLRQGVRRRAAGEPLQYIAGEAPFRYLTVKVRPGVLIPRPETEVLVDEALALIDAAAQGCEGGFVHVVDCCTGSGCIACSIATEREHAQVIATDIAQEALDAAHDNAEACGACERIAVRRSDLLSIVPDGWCDVLVSNPPYVPSQVMAQLPREVAAFEPALALEGGPDGLDVFRRLLAQMPRVLRPQGAFACELHETCLEAAADLAEQAGFAQVRIVADLAGKPRVLVAAKQ